MEFIVNENNLGALQHQLTALYTQLNGDLSDVMDNIGELLEGSTRERFNTKNAPDGTAWKALSALTIELKGNEEILSDSGNLADSITHNYTESSTTVGSPLHYAATHQFGAEIRPKNGKALAFGNGNNFVMLGGVDIPARPFLGISDEDERDINDLINDWLTGAFDG